MKKFTLIAFALLCFGVAKAHMPTKMTPGLKPNITIIPINNLADYNVTFRFIPKPFYAKKEKTSIQNKLATFEQCLRQAQAPVNVRLRYRLL